MAYYHWKGVRPMPRASDQAPASPYIPQVIAVPKVGELLVCFVSPIDGILTHRTSDGTIPCPGEEDCPKGVHRVKPIFKGYAAVWVHLPGPGLWVPEVLEVTEHLEEVLRGRQLAGELWMLTRGQGKRKTRPCVGRYLETRPIDGVFDTWDHRRVVCRMYHTDRICWGVSNPVPPRVVLAAVSAPAPAISAAATAPGAAGPTPEQLNRIRDLAGGRKPVQHTGNGRK